MKHIKNKIKDINNERNRYLLENNQITLDIEKYKDSKENNKLFIDHSIEKIEKNKKELKIIMKSNIEYQNE